MTRAIFAAARVIRLKPPAISSDPAPQSHLRKSTQLWLFLSSDPSAHQFSDISISPGVTSLRCVFLHIQPEPSLRSRMPPTPVMTRVWFCEFLLALFLLRAQWRLDEGE